MTLAGSEAFDFSGSLQLTAAEEANYTPVAHANAVGKWSMQKARIPQTGLEEKSQKRWWLLSGWGTGSRDLAAELSASSAIRVCRAAEVTVPRVTALKGEKHAAFTDTVENARQQQSDPRQRREQS